MSSNKPVTSGQAKLAYIVAIAADLIQLPINLAFFGAMLSVFAIAADAPLEGLDIMLDIGTAGIVSSLLGFHWVLLPSFVLEVIPRFDAAPTWTGCVAYVVWKRKQEGRFLQAYA